MLIRVPVLTTLLLLAACGGSNDHGNNAPKNDVAAKASADVDAAMADALRTQDAVAVELAVGDSAFSAMHSLRGRATFIADLGDPEMITLKAQRRLMEADLLVYAAHSSPALLEMSRRDALRSCDLSSVHILKKVREGLNVVVLSPAIDRTLMKALERAGIAVESLGHQSPGHQGEMRREPTAVFSPLTFSPLEASHDSH